MVSYDFKVAISIQTIAIYADSVKLGLIRNGLRVNAGPSDCGKNEMRNIRLILCGLGLILVSACETPAPVQMGTDGKPLPKLYNLEKQDPAAVQYRMLDAVNVMRQNVGAMPLRINAELTAAAATHARDMSVQNRPWHFGSDGSSPLDRVARVGYQGVFLGEVISETYESELTTLSAWVDDADTRFVILDPNAQDVGIAWFQEPNGKIWWTMTTGGPALSQIAASARAE